MIICDAKYIGSSKLERQKHLLLSEPCQMRGTDSIQCRGLLAYYLDTSVPKDHKIVLAHACHNADCSNPTHLYWASRSENELDKFNGPNGKNIKQKMSKSSMGKLNPRFGVKPWIIPNAHLESWKQANYFYEQYYSKNWDYSKYGQGVTYFCRKYDVAQGSCKTMIKMFRNGWIPNNDMDWINFSNSR